MIGCSPADGDIVDFKVGGSGDFEIDVDETSASSNWSPALSSERVGRAFAEVDIASKKVVASKICRSFLIW